MKCLYVLAFALLSACSSNSGVVPSGNNTYMVSRKGAAGFTDVGTLYAKAVQEAGKYCSGLSQEISAISTDRTKPPYVLGNYP